MDFVAIDFETATSVYSSVCSMGICVVENDEIVTVKEFLIKPTPFVFNSYNIKIHGITPEMVENEPTFDQLWDTIKPYVQNKLIVAHNASFDTGALCATLHTYGIEFPTLKYICTVKLSQDAYPDFPSHKLNNLCASLGITFSHHHAAEDAYACACVLLRIMHDYNLSSLDELCEKFNLEVGKIYPNCRVPCLKKKKKKKKEKKDTAAKKDKTKCNISAKVKKLLIETPPAGGGLR